jgi:inositol hexakisphosphate
MLRAQHDGRFSLLPGCLMSHFCRSRCLATACLLIVTLSAFGQVDPRSPLLVLDAKTESQKKPFRFRTTRDPYKEAAANQPSREGLDRLNASGSGTFAEEALLKIKKAIPAPRVTVVDLRQETHGFVNGLSVSWWSERNAANKGKTRQQVLDDEKERLAALKKPGLITAVLLAVDDDKKVIKQLTPIDVKVQRIASEQELCEANGLQYQRILVTDREAPDNAEVDRFVKLVSTLPADQWLHFHCEHGSGRTTTFMAIYDMMRNARKVSLNDVLRRQWLLGGADLFTDPPQDSWRYPGAVARRHFLEKFHAYCQATAPDFEQSWSSWLAEQGKNPPRDGK